MRRCRSSLVLGIVLMLVIDLRAEQPLAASTIVVYNKAALDSPELARFYAQHRLRSHRRPDLLDERRNHP